MMQSEPPITSTSQPAQIDGPLLSESSSQAPSIDRAPVAATIVLATLLLAGIAVRMHFNDLASLHPGDEAVYFTYMTQLRDAGGIAHYEAVVRQYLTNPDFRFSPSPSRYGFILTGYAWCRLMGGFSAHAIANLSTLCSVGLLLLTTGLARRAGGMPLALATAALCLASPLELGMGRRALSDMTFALVQVGSVWAYYEAQQKSSGISMRSP